MPPKATKTKLLVNLISMNKIPFEMFKIVEMGGIFMKMRKKEKQKVCENLKVLA